MKYALLTFAAVLFTLPAFADEPAKLQDTTPPKPFVYTPKATDVVMGKNNAHVVVVEYASLSCPHCSHFYNDVMPKLAEKYIDTGKVKFVYRDFPLNGQALKAAELVQCVEKDRRHEFIKVLFKMQERWAYTPAYQEALGNIAALGGIGKDTFDKCMADPKLEASVLAVAKEAEDDYKVRSTPTFYINGNELKGAHDLDNIGKNIDTVLEAKVKK